MDSGYNRLNQEGWSNQSLAYPHLAFPSSADYDRTASSVQGHSQNATSQHMGPAGPSCQFTGFGQPLHQWGALNLVQDDVPRDGLHIFNSQGQEMAPIRNQQFFPNELDPLSILVPTYDPPVAQNVNAPRSPELAAPFLPYIPIPPSIPLDPLLVALTGEPVADQDDAPGDAPSEARAPQHSKFADEFSSPGEEKQRDLLDRCLSSDWLRRNELETTPRRQSILLGFLSRPGVSKFRCLFKDCSRIFDRRDRALGHIRVHLSHRPFPCGEKCGTVGCTRRFYSPPHLRDHIKSSRANCDACGKYIFQKNLPRHRLTCPIYKQRGAASTSRA